MQLGLLIPYLKERLSFLPPTKTWDVIWSEKPVGIWSYGTDLVLFTKPSHSKNCKALKENPAAKFIAHPESESQVLDIAQYIGSTSGLLNFVEKDSAQIFIVATEAGILHEMKKRCPQKTFIPAPVEDETCACSECAFMKLNTLEKLYLCWNMNNPR